MTENTFPSDAHEKQKTHSTSSGQAPERTTIRGDLWLAVRLAWSFGYIIAIPAVAFGFGGAYLDKTQGTSPLFLILGLALALTLSSLGIVRKVREIMGKS